MNWDLPVFASLNGIFVDTMLFAIIASLIGINIQLRRLYAIKMSERSTVVVRKEQT